MLQGRVGQGEGQLAEDKWKLPSARREVRHGGPVKCQKAVASGRGC